MQQAETERVLARAAARGGGTSVPLIDCPRCYRGTMLREGEELSCLQCGFVPCEVVPIDFEEYPAQTGPRRQRRNTPRLRETVKGKQ